jgi:hypothetical protein
MTRIFLSKSFGWKVLALSAALIVSVAWWQFGVAGKEQLSANKHSTSSAKLLTAARMADESKPSAPYDLSLVNADPTYYERVDALRLYQTAPVPDGEKRHEELRIIGEAYRLAVSQSWLEQPLVVLAKPGRPVTFVALDSGNFPNGDVSITIKADERGLAATSFFVTNEGHYRVLAGSPENAGPAAFYVNCMSKSRLDDVRSGRYAERYLAEVKANKKRQAAAAADVVERVRQRRATR